MTDRLENDLDVQVAVEDGAIIVTLPGTSFCVVYRKGADPWLLVSDIRDDPKLTDQQIYISRALGSPPTTRRVSWGGSFRLRDMLLATLN